MGVEDLLDKRTYFSLRSVWLLYRVDSKFAEDINIIADKFVLKRGWNTTGKLAMEMSIAYLIEEVALNLRIRVGDAIDDEYYLGETLNVLPRLYRGEYIKTPAELIGRRAKSVPEYRFFEWGEKGWAEWVDRPVTRSAKFRLIDGGA